MLYDIAQSKIHSMRQGLTTDYKLWEAKVIMGNLFIHL